MSKSSVDALFHGAPTLSLQPPALPVTAAIDPMTLRVTDQKRLQALIFGPMEAGIVLAEAKWHDCHALADLIWRCCDRGYGTLIIDGMISGGDHSAPACGLLIRAERNRGLWRLVKADPVGTGHHLFRGQKTRWCASVVKFGAVLEQGSPDARLDDALKLLAKHDEAGQRFVPDRLIGTGPWERWMRHLAGGSYGERRSQR